LILVFALNGIIAAIVGACYAELVSAIPRAGGPYYWLKMAIGPRWGFFAGWVSWFANSLACSLYALGFGVFAANIKRTFRMPLVPFLPWIEAISCVGLSFSLIDLSLSAWITASIWIVIGVVVNCRMPEKQ